MKKWLPFSLILPLMLPVQAVAFQPTITLQQDTLSLCASSPMKKMLFDLGEVALYALDCQSLSAESLTDQPVYLSFRYARSFDAEDFIDSSETLIRRNSDADKFAQIAASLSAFNANYEAISDGERYDIGWSEQTGLILKKNDRLLSQSDSAQLADVYFRIWFGDKPFSTRLKNNLLPD
ncbi:hypothetical protein Q7C_340 [Methylophaga frappieri]|uniref:Chalcone isomerase domain-containing protein n=1 Tax=Methylophaga frappieri (strain ATCC BAA-2434 / DSM 25690 / JAM7) TaxID=754477 RepID=I1YF25_METFJ|nr:chalcone isomerase family protein [Methylophaga frappieri]AFJ01518.1 hypothetical protein Q7C_340 [Methylophaga frappieri]